MIKNLKKAFTIIELVIVIAVIAILAAVMIPTYSSLVKKANQSADIQAVKQMNTILALDEVDSNKSIADVHRALKAEGLDSENFTPLVSDTYFYWIEEENRIVYVDSEKKVIYPEDLKSVNLSNNAKYCSLNGVIGAKQPNISNGGKTATVETAEELYYLSSHLDANLEKIEFTESEIDVHGAEINLVIGSGKNVTIEGKTGGTTIKNATSFTSKLYDHEKEYAGGFVGLVDEGSTGAITNLTIKNITIDGGVYGDLELGGIGALVGRINNNTKVAIDNCRVLNTTINGKNKVGALVGSVAKCELTITNCEVYKCTVNCSEGESGKAIGCIYNGPKVAIDKEFSEWVTETTLNLIETDKREQFDASLLTIENKEDSTANISKPQDCTKIIRQVKKGEQMKFNSTEKELEEYNGYSEYRMFADDAYMTAVLTAKPTVTIDSVSVIIDQHYHDKTEKIICKLGGEQIMINVLKFFK